MLPRKYFQDSVCYTAHSWCQWSCIEICNTFVTQFLHKSKAHWMKFFALWKIGKCWQTPQGTRLWFLLKIWWLFQGDTNVVCLRTGEYFRACSQSRRPSSDNVQDGGPAFISRKVLLISVSTVCVILTQLDSWTQGQHDATWSLHVARGGSGSLEL